MRVWHDAGGQAGPAAFCEVVAEGAGGAGEGLACCAGKGEDGVVEVGSGADAG